MGMVCLVDLAVKQYMPEGDDPVLGDIHGLHRLIRLVLSVAGCNAVTLQSLPMMPELKHLTLESCVEFSQSSFQNLASKCPNLTTLTIGCHPFSIFMDDFDGTVRLPHLQRIKIENWHGMPVNTLKPSLKNTVQFTEVPSPDMELQLNEGYDRQAIQAVFKNAQPSGMEQVPINGEYFTPTLVDELISKRDYDLLKMLVRYGADVDYGNPAASVDIDGQRCSTALHFAAHRGDIQGQLWVLHMTLYMYYQLQYRLLSH